MGRICGTGKPRWSVLFTILLFASVLVVLPTEPKLIEASAQSDPQVPDPFAVVDGITNPARKAQPVVLTGAQMPQWSRLAGVGVAPPGSGFVSGPRSAHNGNIVVPRTPGREFRSTK